MNPFSKIGLPSPGGSVSWCVKLKSSELSGMPRSVLNRMLLTFAPISIRRRPSVCARSAKIGPLDTFVRTGAPPSNE
jgi:hypothetical protein